MKTIAQAALYPLYKQEIPNSLRLEFLSSVRSLIQQGNIFDEVPIYRLITPDIEVSLSPIGCCELYGDFNSFFDLLPIILRVSKRLNLFYNWVFIDPISTESKRF
jgi:hypothetical protein